MLKPTNFLDQPFSEASLADHREFQLLMSKERSVWSRSIRGYLGLEADLIVCHQMDIWAYELPNLHRALKSVFADWTLTRTTGLTERDYRDLCMPGYQYVAIRPNRRRPFLSHGALFYELPDRQRRVISIGRELRDQRLSVELVGPANQHSQLVQTEHRLRRWMTKRHYLRRQAIRANGALLHQLQRITWDDVALPATIRDLLEHNIHNLLKLGHIYRANGIPLRRGILLYGPPGTGKTLIGKLLASSELATFIWVTASDIHSQQLGMRHAFQLARQLRPTILFFEDLDLYASDRDHVAHRTALGELLTQMDGLEGNDGVFVVATSNDLQAIEPALKDRPSRFDVVLHIGLPDAAARRLILQRKLPHLRVAQDVLDAAAAATDGLSGAQVQEVALLTVQAAILRGALDAHGKARPNSDDVVAAVAHLTGKQPRKIGFGSNPISTGPA